MKQIFFIAVYCLFFLSCQAQNKQFKYVLDESCTYYINKDLNKKIYIQSDVRPIYPHDEEAGFNRYINKNISISKSDFNKIPFKRIFFIVNISSEGEILSTIILDRNENIKKENQLNLLEKDIIQIISKSENWIPAKCRDENVASQVLLVWSMPRLR